MPTPQKPQQDSKGCYLLTSKEELYWYARFVNGPWDVANKNRSACASLQNDIVVYKNLLKDSVPDSEKDDFFIWFSIEFFDGTFNGNGHAISGLLMYDGCDDPAEGYPRQSRRCSPLAHRAVSLPADASMIDTKRRA